MNGENLSVEEDEDGEEASEEVEVEEKRSRR